MPPDIVSSLFPDRPIRPLPKRRLREQLSPEAADSIRYPPSTHESAPLFYYPPYTVKEEDVPHRANSTTPPEQVRRAETARNYTPRRNGVGFPDGDEEEPNARSTLVTRSPPEILTRATRNSSRPDQARYATPQPPLSTASSVDGYDSFENTNNKKKRKIPSAGDPTLSAAHALNNDISSLSISAGTIQSPRSEFHGDRTYAHPGGHPGSGTFTTAGSQGISGSGRGRLGRSRNGRSPLRALSDGNGSWTGRNLKASSPQWASAEQASGGIISDAIANAEKLRPQRQENVSLLHQHASTNRPTPASTQFTFTCDSQVPGTVQWPGTGKHSMGTQTGHGMSSRPDSNSTHDDASTKAMSGGSRDSRRKNRQRLERELNAAARHRRQLAAEDNHRSPPKLSDIWICEFCEYERIFGEPPRALIRDYEIKDRRHRQEEADRKRLLEKAKAKSRKGRKSGKAPSKGAQGGSQSVSQDHSEQVGDPGGASLDTRDSQSTAIEDDEFGDEFEDEYPDPAPDVAGRAEDKTRNPLPQLIKA